MRSEASSSETPQRYLCVLLGNLYVAIQIMQLLCQYKHTLHELVLSFRCKSCCIACESTGNETVDMLVFLCLIDAAV